MYSHRNITEEELANLRAYFFFQVYFYHKRHHLYLEHCLAYTLRPWQWWPLMCFWTLQDYFVHLKITRASVILTLGVNWLIPDIWNISLLAVWKIVWLGLYDYPFTGFPAKPNSKECCFFPISSAKLVQTSNSLILSLTQSKFWFSAVNW